MDLSDNNKGKHEEVTDLLNKSEPCGIKSIYIFTLKCFLP